MIKIYNTVGVHDFNSFHPEYDCYIKDHTYFKWQIINYIVDNYDDVELINLFPNEENIHLTENINKYEEWDLNLEETDLLINFNGNIRAISFSEKLTTLFNFLIDRNKQGDILAMTHVAHSNNELLSKSVSQGGEFKTQFNCKFKEMNQVTFSPHFDFRVFREYRKFYKKIFSLKDKFFFFGNCDEFRNAPLHLTQQYNQYFDSNAGNNQGYRLSSEQYFYTIAEYKIGLAISGIGEVCYRDIEYLSMGIPYIKMEYKTQLNPKLIPDYHYISIPRIDNYPEVLEREGSKLYAQLYLDKFLEVKDNTEFLNFISKNQMEYFDNYLEKQKRVNHILTILEM